jgi:hypothetical protein
MRNSQSTSSTYSRILWIAVNAVIWGIGITIGLTLEDTIGRVLYDTNDNLWGLFEVVSNIISAIAMGLSIGIGQGILLRRFSPIIEWKWAKATLSGFVVATLLLNIFGVKIFPDTTGCFFCIGSFHIPPTVIYDFGIWSTFGLRSYTIGNPIASGILGLGIGLSQWFTLKAQRVFTHRWIVWSMIGYILAFLSGIIATFVAEDILVIGAITGMVFGLVTMFPVSSQLESYAKHEEKNLIAA